MSGMDFEYAIKKDVRNNPIVREVDEARQRELWKSMAIGVVAGARAAVLGLAALRAAAPRLPDRADAARARRRGRDRPPAAARDRHAAVAAADRALATEQLHLVAPDARRGHRDRTRHAGRAAGEIRRRRPLTAMPTPFDAPATGRVAVRAAPTRHAGPRRRRCDWRDTMRSRIVVCASLLAVWTVGIEARLVYLQVIEHADLVGARRAAADAQRRRRRPSAATSSIAAAACWRPASTPTRSARCRPRSTIPRRPRRKICDALGDCTARSAQALAGTLASTAAFAYVAPPGVARRSAARRGARTSTASASSRRAAASIRTRSWRRTSLGYVGIDNDGLGGIESTYDSQIRGKAGTILVQTDAKRHAFSRFERPPTAGVERRADDRRVPAAHRRARAARRRGREPRRRRQRDHHESAHRRDSGDGERADVQPERLSRVRRRRRGATARCRISTSPARPSRS